MLRTAPNARNGEVAAPRRGADASPPTRDVHYIPQLDALRFFAILGVIITHEWYPEPLPWIFRGVDPGHLGVRLFFVLSGFLITGILLDCRQRAEEGHRRSVLAQRFYVRRFLRIYPLYYAVLAGIILIGIEPTRLIWPWLASYTTNIYVSVHHQWIGDAGIFWTLAVEEQFYLVWPLLVLLVPRRWLIPILVTIICMAPMYRWWASARFPWDLTVNGYTSGTFTLAVFDCLGVGALLAILTRWESTRDRIGRWLTRIALPVGVVGVLVLLAVAYYHGPTASFVFGETFLALVFAWLVGTANRGFTGRTGRLLEWRPLPYLGRISYGLYVFHAFMPVFLLWLGNRLGLSYTGNPRWLNLVLVAAATFAFAALSWRFYERPINGLKRYFPYRDNGRRVVHEAVPELSSTTST
jgi:peptidoglycan/LPS O-acetylase OafA/YrhL